MTQPPDQPPTVPGQPYPPSPAAFPPPPGSMDMDVRWSATGGPVLMHDATPPQAPKKKSRRLVLLVGIAVALFVVIGATIGVTLAVASGKSDTTTPVTRVTAPDVVAEPNPFDADGLGFEDPTTDAPSVPTVTPGKGDFDLKAKITDKQCFGSAGCSLEFKVEVTYNGDPLDQDVTWQITYEATGVDDGPIIGTFELTGTKYDQPTEFASTKRKSDKVTVKVTDIERSGY